MNLPKVKLTKEEQKEAILKKHLSDEKVHKLVVKIISWKSGILEGTSIAESNKVTKNEWSLYRKHILKISRIESVDKVKTKLEATYASIQNNGGFE